MTTKKEHREPFNPNRMSPYTAPSSNAGPLTTLKIVLGLMGRGDFLTAMPDWPGDLIYPDEKVCAFIRECISHGCEIHSIPLTRIMEKHRNSVVKKYDFMTKTLKQSGWATLGFFSCDVALDTKRVAEEILAVLASSRKVMPTMEKQSRMDLARLAHLDAASRTSSQSYKSFLLIISGMPVHFAKSVARYVAVEHNKWEPEAFSAMWKVCVHHGIIDPYKGNLIRGKLFEAALLEAGIPRGAEPWRHRSPTRDELTEQESQTSGNSSRSEQEESAKTLPSTPEAESPPMPTAPGSTT